MELLLLLVPLSFASLLPVAALAGALFVGGFAVIMRLMSVADYPHPVILYCQETWPRKGERILREQRHHNHRPGPDPGRTYVVRSSLANPLPRCGVLWINIFLLRRETIAV